jgi:NTE family protein
MFHRVLILAGDGAKGVYALGALKAFRDAQIRFDPVAGTSVGALNAILWELNHWILLHPGG